MKTFNIKFLITILLSLSTLHIISGAFLTDKIKILYSGKPIRQVMFNDKSGFIAMAGTQPFSYNMDKEIVQYKKMGGKSYLNKADSSILKRLENKNIAMVCGIKLIWIFDDQGNEFGNYDVSGSYVNSNKCSLTEIRPDIFLISSLVDSKYKSPAVSFNCEVDQYYDYYTHKCKSCLDGEYYDERTKECKTCPTGENYDYVLKKCTDCSHCASVSCSYDSNCAAPQCKEKTCQKVNAIVEQQQICSSQGYLLQVIEYSSSAKQFVSTYTYKMCPFGKTFQISCESLLENQKYFCFYFSKGIKGQLFSPKLVPISNEISFDNREFVYSKLFQFNEKTLIVFYMNENQLFGRILSYDETQSEALTASPEKGIVIEGSSFSFRSTDIAKISEEMLLAFLLSNTYIFIRKFYNTLEPNGPLIKIYSNTDSLNQASVGGISEIEYGFLFCDRSSNYLMLVEFPKCKTMITYTLVTKTTTTLEDVIESKNITNEKIMFIMTSPERITTAVNDYKLNQWYNLKDIKIGFKEGGTYEYTFITMVTMNKIDIHSSDCKVIFNACYKTCKTCSAFGTDDNHQCEKCADGYFFITPEKCVNDLLDGFYVDPTDNTIQPCHPKCKTCKDAGTDDDTNCLTCKNDSTNSADNNYLSPIKPNHCQREPIDGYYIDETKNEYVPCYKNCKTCSKQGFEINAQYCDICKDGFIIKNVVIGTESVTNCVEICDRSIDYVYIPPGGTAICEANGNKCPPTYDIYIPEQNECAATCKYNNFLSQNDKTNSTQKVCISNCADNDQFNFINGGVKECVNNCHDKSMVTIPETSTCQSSCPNDKYLDTSTNKCVSKCPNDLFVYNKECINVCNPDKPVYVGTSPRICKTECPNGNYIEADGQCVTQCPFVVDPITKQCLTTCPDYIVESQGIKECVKTCPPPLIHSENQATPNQKICVDNCGDLYYHDDTNTCYVKCPDKKPQDEENKVCLHRCPDSYYVEESTQLCKKIVCKEDEYYVPTMSICEKDCDKLDMYFNEEAKICVTECPFDYVINKITKVCMTQEDLDKELADRIENLDDNIKDLAEHYPSIDQGNETFKIYNSTDLDKDEGNTPIHLGECERILKILYKIDMDEPLLIVRYEPPKGNTYDFLVYSQDGRRLDLSHCASIPIIVEPPVSDQNHDDYVKGKEYYDKNIRIFDHNDPFFNDICYSNWVNDENKDIPLHIRQTKLFIPSSSLCQENCSIRGIDYTHNTVQCDCAAVQIPYNFQKKTNYWNHILAKCYKLVFKADNFWLNAGFIAFFILSLIQSGIVWYFISTKFSSLFIYLSNLHNHLIVLNQNMTIPGNPPKLGLSITKVMPYQSCNPLTDQTSNSNSNFDSGIQHLNQDVQKALIKRYTLTNKDLLGHEQLNDMDYLLARIYDTRPFIIMLKYYCLRTQPFINAFFIPSKKRLKSIRISLFFLDIAIDLFFNTIFYSDDYIEKTFNSYSCYFLPKTIYASLSGMLLKKLITFIPSTVYHLRRFHYEKNAKEMIRRSSKFFHCYKHFALSYFILSSLLLLGFWYYVAAFCAVYHYSQYNWLIGSTLSILFANLFPFAFALLFTVMRVLSLKYKLKWVYELQVIISPFY